MNEPKTVSFGDDDVPPPHKNQPQPPPRSPSSGNGYGQEYGQGNAQSSQNSQGTSSQQGYNNNPALPRLITTTVQGESFGDVTYHLDGELVPVLTVDLSRSQGVYFEHHILLWKHATIQVGLKSLKRVFKRFFSGMPILMTEAVGRGHIAFSRDGAGHIVPIHLKHGQAIHVREHQFLAATNNIDYDFEMVRGIGSLLFGGSGIFIDKFFAPSGDGIVWVHGYGNVFEKTLADGEMIDVEPGGWVYKSPSVKMEVKIDNLSSGFFGGTKFLLNRFIGPGKVGIQSMYMHPGTGTDDGANNNNEVSNAGSILQSFLR